MCVWLESAATKGIYFASARLQSKSQYLRECHPREPSPKKTGRKNWLGKYFFSAFRCPSPLNNVLELPWIFVLSYSWWLGWQRICLQCKKPGFEPWVGKIPWRKVWQLTPVFLPGEFHRQRSLVHWVAKSQTRLKQLSNHACTKPAYTASQTICPSKGFHLPRGRGTFSSHKAPSAFQTIS